MGGDVRWALDVAAAAAAALAAAMAPACERLEIAGSVRRRKASVGDIELVYIPKKARGPDPEDLFATRDVNLADLELERLERTGALERRMNALGRETYGPKIKLMRLLPAGLPVDLFEATPDNWWNYLTCRTGPAESNALVATRAKARGWKWRPYGSGFERLSDGAAHAVTCERDVFEFVGLPYYEPEERWRLNAGD